MKQFLKYVLATVVGVVLVGVVLSLLSLLTLVGLTATQSSPRVPDNALLVIRLDGQLAERSQENPLADLLGNDALEQQGLDDLLRAIHTAKTNDKVKGIYIESGLFAGASPAMLQELRQALLDFKSAKKPIIAYGDQYTQGAYYLCSVADSLIINSQGMLDWKGLSVQSLYFKDLLDKLGVKMEIFKVGTYKSAVEPYFLNEMSEANREQITVFCGEVWNRMVGEVSKSRGIPVAKLQTLADSLQTVRPAKTYKANKLVDKLAYSDEVPQIIARTLGMEDADDYETVSVADMASVAENTPKGTSGKVVAVYYATGTIVESQSTSFTNEEQIVGRNVVADLQELAEDDDVQAVVLRVNSPGGSAYASEQIWHQVKNIEAKKPIVVSMGGYAASGGYYISCAADWIVAEPTTLTGSIGIFGTFPVAEKLLNDKLGIHFQTVNTNAMSDFGNISREMNEGERLALQCHVNNGYELFTQRCADGRKTTKQHIKQIAEGRVWTGEHAKRLGLVDQLGNLDDAVEMAKKLAGMEDATVLTYPAKSSFLDNLLNEASGDSYAETQLRNTLGEFFPFFQTLRSLRPTGEVQAALPYYFKFNL